MAVRIGFDDNRAMGGKETGGRAALPIFREIMLRVDENGLVGRVPPFPREIEESIDESRAMQVALDDIPPQPPPAAPPAPQRIP